MSDPKNTYPEIVGLRGDIRGIYVSYRCTGCHQIYERYRETIAGVPLGFYTCPHCGVRIEMTPELSEEACCRLAPQWDLQSLVELTDDASRITTNWYKNEAIARILTFRGVDLGAPTERELLSYVTDGLMRAALESEPPQ